MVDKVYMNNELPTGSNTLLKYRYNNCVWIDASDSSNYSVNGSNELTSVTDKLELILQTVSGTPTYGNTQNGLCIHFWW